MITAKDLKQAYKFKNSVRSQVEHEIMDSMFELNSYSVRYEDYDNELTDKKIEELNKSGFKVKSIGEATLNMANNHCKNCNCDTTEPNGYKTYLISWK